MLYRIDAIKPDLIVIGFGNPASNDKIVADINNFDKSKLPGGGLVKIHGPASLPVAFTLAALLMGRCQAIAIFDPKLRGYVVCTSRIPEHSVGKIIPLSEWVLIRDFGNEKVLFQFFKNREDSEHCKQSCIESGLNGEFYSLEV